MGLPVSAKGDRAVDQATWNLSPSLRSGHSSIERFDQVRDLLAVCLKSAS